VKGDITVVGMDPSLNNWGLAKATYNVFSGDLHVHSIGLIQPEVTKKKTVRNNSKDLSRAVTHFSKISEYCKDATAVFVEVPYGSQTARAMASYGICIGVLGAFKAAGHPIFELTPMEVKLHFTGDKNAKKSQMIETATTQWPNLPWPTQTKKGVTSFVGSKVEHIADAVGTLQTGLTIDQFTSLITILRRTL